MRNLRYSLITLMVILFLLQVGPVEAQRRGQRARDTKPKDKGGKTQQQPPNPTEAPTPPPTQQQPPPPQAPPQQPEKQTQNNSQNEKKDIIIVSLALNWADLWDQSASLDAVPQAERDENIREVLLEVGNKMKRRHKVSELVNFTVKKVSQNLALAEYPLLSGQSEIELNLIANQILQLGGTVLNVNIFINNKPVQIVDMGLGGQGQNYKTEEHPPQQQHEGINEKPAAPTPTPAPNNPAIDQNPGNPYAKQPQQQAPKQPQVSNVPNYKEEISRVVLALESYDAKLKFMHDDNEKMVADYHERMNAIDAKMIELKDAIDREYLPKFKDEEDKYSNLTMDMQDKYNVIYYERADAEEEYYRLMHEQEEHLRTVGRSEEL